LSADIDANTRDYLRQDIEHRLRKLEGIFSTYADNSDLTRFNRQQPMRWIDAPSELIEVTRVASQLFTLSSGAFDPTVGPLVELWGFGAKPSSASVPQKASIDAMLERVGMNAIEWRTQPRSQLRSLNSNVQLDYSALAKGYAVDEICELLNIAGLQDYLVDIGGEIRVRGKNPNREPWRIGLESPATTFQKSQPSVVLDDAALATSGRYRNNRTIEGHRFSHIIDPRTGSPIAHELQSVSVLSQTAALADAYATALLVMGPDAGLEWARQNGIDAYFVVGGPDDFRRFGTGVFSTLPAVVGEN
ncbi:MAG: FAD:protein FMN transferase, partial [Pseudomonadota bacterium]